MDRKNEACNEAFVPRFLVLFVTTACNLQCPYCYAGDIRDRRPMEWDVAETALSLASRGGAPFHLQLSGGEPTLEPALIERIVSWVRSRRIPATVALQTNGTCLDGRLVRFLNEQKVRIGISIDGPPMLHEQIRGGTDKTLKSLDLLARMGVPFRTTTVVSEKNVSNLPQLALMLGRYPNLRGMALDLLVRKGRAVSGTEVRHCDSTSLTAGVRKLMETLEIINGSRRDPVLLRERQRLEAPAKGANPGDYCHACRGESMAVLPGGSVYPCSQTAGDPELYSGRIDRLEVDRLRTLDRHGLRETAREDCGSCVAERFCRGECPSRLHYNDSRAAKLACVLYRTLFSFVDRAC